MAVGRRKHIASGTLGTTLADMVTAGTAPTDGSAKLSVTAMVLCNKTAAAVTVDVARADSGGNVLAYILKGMTIPANDSYVHTAAIDLMGGQKLRGLASAASAVDYDLSGVEASDL